MDTLALCFNIDPASVIRIIYKNTTRTLVILPEPNPNQMAKRFGMGQSNRKLA